MHYLITFFPSYLMWFVLRVSFFFSPLSRQRKKQNKGKSKWCKWHLQQQQQRREAPGAAAGRGCRPGWVMMSSGRTTVTLATATCNSCLTIVGFIVAGAKEAKSKMKQRTMVSDTSSTTHFNHSWQKLIQEEFFQWPPVQHVLLLLLLLLLFWPKIIFWSFFDVKYFFAVIICC